LWALQKHYEVTATTGIAAYNVGGVTIHAWAGIGKGESEEDLLKAWDKKVPNFVFMYKLLKEEWRKIHVLVIDEVSMLSGKMLDTLNKIAKEIRGNELPFGGIQLVTK
jgi:ATP-dependent DNA helicase PIF1